MVYITPNRTALPKGPGQSTMNVLRALGNKLDTREIL